MTTADAPLLAKLKADQVTARKAQDKDRVLLLGVTIAEVQNREIELRRPLTNEDVVDVVRRGIKKRRESVAMYEKAGRAELAAKELAEAAALGTYLPEQVDPEVLREAVREAIAGGASNIGAVMAKVMPRFKGKADGSVINAMAREELAKA